MATYPQTFSFRDAKGQTSTIRMWIVNATAAGALAAGQAVHNALDALTNASPGPAKGAYNTAPAPNAYGTAAQYANIEDKALLTFQTATGAIHRYQLPAPLVAAFDTDQETVKTPDGGDAGAELERKDPPSDASLASTVLTPTLTLPPPVGTIIGQIPARGGTAWQTLRSTENMQKNTIGLGSPMMTWISSCLPYGSRWDPSCLRLAKPE
jgi:hypothetical protein